VPCRADPGVPGCSPATLRPADPDFPGETAGFGPSKNFKKPWEKPWETSKHLIQVVFNHPKTMETWKTYEKHL